MRFFERPTTKHVGVMCLVFLMGLALGNGWRTREAMVAQAETIYDRCGQTIKAKEQAHDRADRDTFGFTPEDLKAPLRAGAK